MIAEILTAIVESAARMRPPPPRRITFADVEPLLIAAVDDERWQSFGMERMATCHYSKLVMRCKRCRGCLVIPIDESEVVVAPSAAALITAAIRDSRCPICDGGKP